MNFAASKFDVSGQRSLLPPTSSPWSNPVTYGGLFGPDHQIIDSNSKKAKPRTSKLGDFDFLSIRHIMAEF